MTPGWCQACFKAPRVNTLSLSLGHLIDDGWTSDSQNSTHSQPGDFWELKSTHLPRPRAGGTAYSKAHLKVAVAYLG